MHTYALYLSMGTHTDSYHFTSSDVSTIKIAIHEALTLRCSGTDVSAPRHLVRRASIV